MQNPAAAPPTAYGPRRHVARLFGVRLISDVYERVCELGVRPPLDAKRRRRLDSVRDAEALFIHIPKNAGMSVSMALYQQQIKHASIRYYAKVAPRLVESVTSFALVRDPVERFLSAYCYGKAGGSRDNRVSLPFRSDYMAFQSVDDALDHLEDVRCPYHLDHIFRPQSWYITDKAGTVAVDRLLLVEEIERIADIAPQLQAAPIPHLNKGRVQRPALSLRQLRRVRRLYGQDFEIVDPLRAALKMRAAQRLFPAKRRG